MKKLVFIVSLTVLFAATSMAQTPPPASPTGSKRSLVPDTNVPKTMLKEKQAPSYPYSREADIVWSRKVWRTIDLRQKLNYPLYFPTVEMQERKSLVQTLVNAANEGKIKLYDTDTDEFTTILTPEEVRAKFGATERTEVRPKLDGSGDTTIVIRGEFNWAEVRELIVKEEWIFDKHYSRVFVRVIGICPVRVYSRELRTGDDEVATGDEVKTKLFWAYYPESRNVLASTPCFISANDVTQVSFDDIFQIRRFDSYISAISNQMNNRLISSYTRTGLEAMLEAQRIEKELFNFEHDLWEY